MLHTLIKFNPRDVPLRVALRNALALDNVLARAGIPKLTAKRAGQLASAFDTFDTVAEADAAALVAAGLPQDTADTVHGFLHGKDGRALAKRIAVQPPHALRLAKSLLRQGQQASYDTIMEMSAAAQGLSHLTEDHIEGVDALLEKREPVFKGA